jgi:hypothetical protein
VILTFKVSSVTTDLSPPEKSPAPKSVPEVPVLTLAKPAPAIVQGDPQVESIVKDALFAEFVKEHDPEPVQVMAAVVLNAGLLPV